MLISDYKFNIAIMVCNLPYTVGYCRTFFDQGLEPFEFIGIGPDTKITDPVRSWFFDKKKIK